MKEEQKSELEIEEKHYNSTWPQPGKGPAMRMEGGDRFRGSQR